MRYVKQANGLLWAVNVLLGLGIGYYAFYNLVSPEREDYLKDVQWDSGHVPGGGGGSKTQDYRDLRFLPNPVIPRGVEAAGPQISELERVAKLLGTLRIVEEAGSDRAYLQVIPTNQYVTAYLNQPVTYRGQLVNDLRGWTLTRLFDDGAAAFTNGSKEVILRRGDLTVAGAAGAASGKQAVAGAKTFDINQSKSQKTASNDGGEHWNVDMDEVNWAMENVEALLQGVSMAPHRDGGVVINSVGGFASTRGFKDGDVVTRVNGHELRSPTDLQNYANDPQFRSTNRMIIEVNRQGRPYTITFQPDFRNRAPR